VTATNSGPVCSGTATIDLAATTIAGATYSWTGPNGFTSSAQNPASVPIPSTPGTYTFTVDVTDNGSTCSSTTTVTVYGLPPVDAGVAVTVCQGQPVTLSGSGAQTYSWNNGISNGVSFTPSASQTYTVTGTDANGCVNTDQVSLTVNPLPTVGGGVPQSVCQGDPVILIGSGAQSYSWNNGVSNGVSFVPGSTQTYTLTGTDANGCQNTSQVTVTVHPLPVVEAGLPQSICQGTSVTLSGSGAMTYTWDNGGTNGVPFTPSATLTYTCTGTDANGCQNTDQVLVVVNPAPVVNAGTDQSVCAGTSVTLTATGAQTYSWNNGVTNGVAFTPGSTQTYTVTGTSLTGCTGSDQVTVTVNPNPVVNAGTDQTICFGSQITLSGAGAVSYSWSNGMPDNSTITPAVGVNTYTLTGTTAFGCQGTDVVVVTVVPVPTAGLGTSTPNTGNPELEVIFINSSLNATTYTFDFGNGMNFQTSDLTATPHGTYTIPGTYTVVLTAGNGICEDTARLTVLVLPFEPMSLTVPNIFTPNGDNHNDVFFVRLKNAVSLEMTIVNRWGNFVAKISEVDGFWDGNIHGDPAAEGVYFYTYTAVGINGETQTGHGDIQLMRD
jgi:gliding motility-associated-like protein